LALGALAFKAPTREALTALHAATQPEVAALDVVAVVALVFVVIDFDPWLR
jgi:hypothetical protein